MLGTAPGRSLLTTDALEASVSALDCRDRQACMGKIVVCAERVVDAPADAVYRYVADMRDHHPRFLPPAFSDFRVESGGTGAGTITRFTVTAGGRTREYRMKVDEPEPGRVLTARGHHDHGLPPRRRLARADLHDLGWRRGDRGLLRADVRATGDAGHLRGRAGAAECVRARAAAGIGRATSR